MLMTACVVIIAISVSTHFLSCTEKTKPWMGGEYTGRMHHGRPDGFGTWRKGRSTLEAEWRAGVPDGFGRYLNGDTSYVGHFKNGKWHGDGRLEIRSDSTVYEGNFSRGLRDGKGTLRDGKGRTWNGVWSKDSLTYGTLSDTDGVYSGTFSHSGRIEGYGSFISNDARRFYEGQWTEGRRDSFGIDLSTSEGIRSGWWKEGRYLGERMRFSSRRVYGIDISHYQHGGRPHGRFKGYPIDWKRLRITSLGKNQKNSVGRVDYPVSFCYIKSTQGTRILNNYYPTDARRARSVGIKVGAYHFMEASKGAPQARWFLKRTTVDKNDLPPMLDVEPLPSQIRRMGGDSVLFHEMLVWLHLVEKATGKKPILYLSQQFVNTRMKSAPEELLTYDVWIARYSEYKPYVRLLYWQHTPYGRVKGIRGDVDINVFNGGKEQFRRYVESGVWP